ncbi:helix-turn-helix transcriptional regulator [Aquimarina sp. 2201CG5-10]|uniref:helix-turn-helix domain-containing protein n=1 Tax=Aquimarina callyspongiae TaxID=3098150 RepID=UPI002AB400AE|nr:helix-turn-helix transcriptional regulator [Aquimarina sp. 2201CG5-10]MDY8133987.1 helix-turn-helix transcriptional regulator [Aquimarina sp. 2201CG5-10]
MLCALFLLSVSSSVYSFNEGEERTKEEGATSYIKIAEKKQDSEGKQLLDKVPIESTAIKNPSDSIAVLKKLALTYAHANQPILASEYVGKYIRASRDLTFVSHSSFKQIEDSEAFKLLEDRYLKKVDLWALFCLYVGFIGIFMTVVLNLRKQSDKIANLLMSVFVFQHSFFIIHVSLLLTNYELYLPHSLYMSTAFSFLYGPLIYFYFKRINSKYQFKLIDILHLVPTILIIALLIPIYMLSAEEKLNLMLNHNRPYITLIVITKLMSLLIYGTLVVKAYSQSIKKNRAIAKIQRNWQRNIVIFCSGYIITYSIYAILVIQNLLSGFLFHLQIGIMASLVLYVSYTAFVQPSIFGVLRVVKGDKSKKESDPEIAEEDASPPGKYEKSGLTLSLSLELKDKLLRLLNEEKVYKQNDITLQKLAELLETTRHNTSQIINEHFNQNFFELINTYRIREAMEILKKEKPGNFNIIDVAYEVGFNNKVTFNKSFKKQNHITPSEYISKSSVA